jgi:signal transduction histidine kinase
MKMKNSIVWRMLAWFLLLALIPLGTVMIFVQRQVNQAILDIEFQAIVNEARLLAADSVNHPGALSDLIQVYGGGEEIAFILGKEGGYLAHSESQKTGTQADNSFTTEILQTFFASEYGSIDNVSQKQIIGFAAAPSENAVAVIVKDSQIVMDTLNSLSSTIFMQLAVILSITTIVSGIAILTVISPLRQLVNFADQVGSGDLDATIDQADLEGEIAVLAGSMSTMTNRVRDLIINLEEKVEARTRDLAIASDVSRQITRVLDMDILLPELVEKTLQGFNLSSVSLYLYDHQDESLILEASASKNEATIKPEAKSLLVSTLPSLVAQVARECKAEIINDIEKSNIHFSNPRLPDIRAEAAFPMLVSNELVGVLDLQSEMIGRFQESEAQIFSTLAEQIAIAVRNAQLYSEQEHMARELERADLMKNQFLASMSHELRTPLNAIINLTQLISMGVAGPVTDEQETMLTTSLNSSNYLLQLINDVLDISKIKAGKLRLYIEENVDLKDEISAVLDVTEPLLQKHNNMLEQPILFIQDIDDDLPLIACDRRRVRQVLLNLLSNAIKFTMKGSITLSVKRMENEFIFAVMDTGSGVPHELHTRIFEPFVQVPDDLRNIQGTGLGLPISRSLAQAHGGDLWVESKLGEGATFFFSLPFHPPKIL